MTTAYAYKNTTDVIMTSSSGGAFWGIAEAFYNKTGGGTAMELNLIQILM